MDRMFAKNMRIARLHARLLQNDLAERLGDSFTKQVISRIEGGGRSVSVGEAFEIAVALDVSLDELLSERFTPSPSHEEAARLARADDETLTPLEMRQKELAMEMIAGMADDD